MFAAFEERKGGQSQHALPACLRFSLSLSLFLSLTLRILLRGNRLRATSSRSSRAEEDAPSVSLLSREAEIRPSSARANSDEPPEFAQGHSLVCSRLLPLRCSGASRASFRFLTCLFPFLSALTMFLRASLSTLILTIVPVLLRLSLASASVDRPLLSLSFFSPAFFFPPAAAALAREWQHFRILVRDNHATSDISSREFSL